MKFIKVGNNTFNASRIIVVSKLRPKIIEVIYDTTDHNTRIDFEDASKCDEFYNELSNKLTSLKSE